MGFFWQMYTPPYIILLIRTFLTLEGIAGQVDPDFNIYEAAPPPLPLPSPLLSSAPPSPLPAASPFRILRFAVTKETEVGHGDGGGGG